MKSIAKLGTQLASLPILADDILEFHAGRLLLLLKLCGKKGSIDGLTKLAKLDFFVRYPDFFATASEVKSPARPQTPRPVESSMVRYRYGPWDHRYYHVLAFLEGTRLIKVDRAGTKFSFSLTESGSEAAKRLAASPSFGDLVTQMRKVKSALGAKTGSALKKLIYTTFSKEVTEREHGEVIS
jgi:hypothetical protein